MASSLRAERGELTHVRVSLGVPRYWEPQIPCEQRREHRHHVNLLAESRRARTWCSGRDRGLNLIHVDLLVNLLLL